MTKTVRIRASDGFTIVELMIALAVLSTILIICTVLMIQIGALYSKGVNSATLQNATRSIMSDMTQTIQFNGSDVQTGSATYSGVTVRAYCIGTLRYSYILGRELGTDNGVTPAVTTNHVLWRDILRSQGACTPLDLTAAGIPSDGLSMVPPDGYEMAANHLRLNRFQVVENPANSHIYDIDVWMSFGDSDLVNTDPATDRSSCNSVAGHQFCAVSELSSRAKRRLE